MKLTTINPNYSAFLIEANNNPVKFFTSISDDNEPILCRRPPPQQSGGTVELEGVVIDVYESDAPDGVELSREILFLESPGRKPKLNAIEIGQAITLLGSAIEVLAATSPVSGGALLGAYQTVRKAAAAAAHLEQALLDTMHMDDDEARATDATDALDAI